MDDTASRRIVFLSRKFPPSVGGMQAFSKHLLDALRAHDGVDVAGAYTWGRSQRWLPLAAIYLAAGAFLRLLRDRDIDTVYGTDGVVSPIILLLGWLFRTRTVITLHGLDITFTNPVYQRLIVPTFHRHDRVVCVSRRTAEAAAAHGVPRDQLTVIPNGVDPDAYHDPGIDRDDAQQLLAADGCDIDLTDKTVLLSTGRLVARKGFHWFAATVMPHLPDDHIYLICGDGPYRDDIADAAAAHGVDDRVHPLGYVSEDLLAALYNTADAFIMPNVPVEGDMEGFGIVAVEAASCGTPVVAADMEGMQDSVIDGDTGVRVPPEDEDAFLDGIEGALAMDRDSVRQATVAAFGWEAQADRYKKVFEEVSL